MYCLSQTFPIISSSYRALSYSVLSLAVWKQCLKLCVWDKVRERPQSTDTWLKLITPGLARKNWDKDRGHERTRRYRPAYIKWNVRKVDCQDYLALSPPRPSLGLITDAPKPQSALWKYEGSPACLFLCFDQLRNRNQAFTGSCFWLPCWPGRILMI